MIFSTIRALLLASMGLLLLLLLLMLVVVVVVIQRLMMVVGVHSPIISAESGGGEHPEVGVGDAEPQMLRHRPQGAGAASAALELQPA